MVIVAFFGMLGRRNGGAYRIQVWWWERGCMYEYEEQKDRSMAH